jgi:MSHA biogenesis protein MshN
MSVVNKMLKDLEARQSQTEEINNDYHAPQKKQPNLLVLVLLILVTAALIFVLINQVQLFDESENAEVTPLYIQPSPTVAIKKMSPVPRKIQKQGQVQPQIESAQPTKANIELVNTAIDLTSPTSALTDEQLSPINNSSIDNITSFENIDTPQKPLETLNSNELVAPVKLAQTSSFSMSGSSQVDNVSSLKQRIAESLNNDNLDLAQSLLSKLLVTEPHNIKARKKLASLLFAQGNFAQSKQLLIQGIDLHPAQSDMRLMLARLYVIQKEHTQAINILAEFEPNTGNQTEYLAYRASLAQQHKRTELAKSDYKILTDIESTNAKWWLGLAIVRDQLGEINMALQAYNKASSLEQLDGSVNDFIQQRILVLTGTQ